MSLVTRHESERYGGADDVTGQRHGRFRSSAGDFRVEGDDLRRIAKAARSEKRKKSKGHEGAGRGALLSD